MVRLCERPGCSNPADVSYGFDAEHLVVWLGGFQDAQGASSGVLCRRHADAMVVPLGWMLDDRREPAPRLFRSPSEAPTGPMIRPRVKRVRPDPATGTVQLQLDEYQASTELAAAVEQAVTEAIAIGHDMATVDPVSADVSQVDVVEPGEPHVDEPHVDEQVAGETDTGETDDEVAPWQPVFDERDDLQGLLKARGRLLSRAFHGVAADQH